MKIYFAQITAINNMPLGVYNHTVLNTPEEVLDWVTSIS